MRCVQPTDALKLLLGKQHKQHICCEITWLPASDTQAHRNSDTAHVTKSTVNNRQTAAKLFHTVIVDISPQTVAVDT